MDTDIEPAFLHYDYPDGHLGEPKLTEDKDNLHLIRARGITTSEEPDSELVRPNQIVGLIEIYRDEGDCIQEIMLTREQIIELLKDMRRVRNMYPETSY